MAAYDGRGRLPARANKQTLLAVIAGVVLVRFGFAYAAEISCRDLETAKPDQLLATVDPQSVQYGGGVRLGKSCYELSPGRTICDWEQTLEDDQMLDPDHRLLNVLSSHITGSGSWQNLLVFGCVSGKVKEVFLGQRGRDTSDKTLLASAPVTLRPALTRYIYRLQIISPIDCDSVMTEFRKGKNDLEIANEMNVLIGSVERCHDAAKFQNASPASNPPIGAAAY